MNRAQLLKYLRVFKLQRLSRVTQGGVGVGSGGEEREEEREGGREKELAWKRENSMDIRQRIWLIENKAMQKKQ